MFVLRATSQMKYPSLHFRSVGNSLGIKTLILFGNAKRRIKVLPKAKLARMTFMGLCWDPFKNGDKLWTNRKMLTTVPTPTWQSKRIWRATSTVVFTDLFCDNMETTSLDNGIMIRLAVLFDSSQILTFTIDLKTFSPTKGSSTLSAWSCWLETLHEHWSRISTSQLFYFVFPHDGSLCLMQHYFCWSTTWHTI